MTRTTLNKSLRIIAILLFGLLGFMLIVVLYFNSKPGQKKLGDLVFNQLSKQIGTPVTGKLSFSIPDWINLEDLLVLDQKTDTLLYSKKAHVDVALFKLLNNQLVIEQVELENTIAKIDKKNGVFNFDYIVSAFSSPTQADTTVAPLKISLDGIKAKSLRVKYEDKDLSQLFNVKLGALNSGFNVFDLDKGIYDLVNSKVSDLYVNGRLGNPSADTTSSGPLPQIKLKEFIGENLNWDIDLGEQTTIGNRANLALKVKNLNLPKMQAEVNSLITNFNEVTFKSKKATSKSEINFEDLNFRDLVFSAENILVADSLMQGRVTVLTFKEKSGFELRKANVLATLKGSRLLLEDVEIATEKSLINTGIIVDLDTSNYAKSKFDAKISDLKLAASEALYFDKTLAKNATFAKLLKDTFTGKGRISGTAEDLSLEHLYLMAPSQTKLTVNGKIHNGKVLGFDLKVSDFVTTEKDLTKFAGPLPASIQLPERLTLNGAIKGNMEDLNAQLFLNSTQGGARFNGQLKNLSKAPSYSGTLDIEDYAVGTLIKNPEVGKLRGSVQFDGHGFDNPNVTFDGHIAEANYGGASYNNINLRGIFHDKILKTEGNIEDSKAQLDLDVVVNMSQEIMTLTGNTSIRKVNLKALGFTQENIELKGDFDINNLIADMKKPFVDFKGRNITVYKDGTAFPIGELTVLTEYGEEEKSLDLSTGFMNLSLSGNFEYDKLQSILLGEVNKYFRLPSYVPLKDSLDFYFDINGTINYDPVFTAFVPSLKTFQPITIKSGLKSEGDIPFSGNIAIPFLQYDSIQVVSTTFEFIGDGKKLSYDLLSEQISNPSFRIRKAALQGKLQENVATFDLSVKDSLDKDIHSLAGFLESDGSKVRVSFDETGSMLFYEDWGGNPYGYIDYSSAGLYVNNVVFSSGSQMLRVNSKTDDFNAPLDVYASNLDLNFLSKAILQDSTLMSGYLNLDLEVVNYMSESGMAFTGEVDISKFYFNQVTLGDLHAKAESDDLEKITVFASLFGLKNEFELTGAYYTKKEESLDFNLDIATLDFKVLEPFLEGIAYDLKGILTGEIAVKGSPSKPNINGEGEFSGMEFRVKETAALLKVDKQKIKLDQSKVLIENMLIKDVSDQEMNVSGSIDLSTLPDFRYNLDISSDNFLIANSERGQSELFYGTAYLATKLNVRGKNSEFRLTGDITAKDKTNLTLLLPDDSYGADLNSVVTFVDFKNPDKSMVQVVENTLSLANAVNINVFLDDKSKVNILMNPITGDMLSATGNARLNVGFDNAGALFVIGRMDIVSGSYEMTYQAIKKRFEINKQSNSFIQFTGNPLEGVMDVTAEYRVPGKKDVITYPNVKKDLEAGNERFPGKLPVDLRVDLVLTGEVMKPNVDFQIVAEKTDVTNTPVQNKLMQFGFTFLDEQGNKENEVSGAVTDANRENVRQNAIMLLVAGNFTAGQIFDSFTSSSGAGYEDLARRSASQIISSQLEKYASGLIKGIDLNVGLQSSGGGDGDRSTNVNLGVSKRLANDRLVVSVGKNFELENKERQSDEIFDNVEANWMITQDGRYRIRVFRRNQNQSAIEGTVMETGLGFIIAIDYDTWKELMNRKKK